MMNNYKTSKGYSVSEWNDGIDVYDEYDNHLTEIQGVSLSRFMDENEVIDDNALEALIEENLLVEDIIKSENDY